LTFGDTVAFSWFILFGKGIVSLLCVWALMAIVVTLVVTMFTLGI